MDFQWIQNYFLHMLNMNYISRKYFAGQLRTTLPLSNTKTSKDSWIKKEVKEVHFAFLSIKVLDLHASPFCDMNNFMEP